MRLFQKILPLCFIQERVMMARIRYFHSTHLLETPPLRSRYAQARFQVNLVVRRDPSFPPLANLNNSVTVIPLFWAQEGYDELPAGTIQKLALALMLPNIGT